MTRLISGAILAAAALAAILWLPLDLLRVLACAVAALAAHEYVRVAGGATGASRWLTVAAAAATCWLLSRDAAPPAAPLLAIAIAWVGAEVLFLGRTIHQASVNLFAPAYVGLPLGLLVAIQGQWGAAATLLLLATVVVSDSGQYYSGRLLGKRPLAPAISPKKTVEGAVGGVVLGTAFMALAGPRVFPAAPVGALALLGTTLVVLGICGDLFESRMKRVAGIKDSSSLIPGHGGVLDRVDALLFAVPAYYLSLQALR